MSKSGKKQRGVFLNLIRIVRFLKNVHFCVFRVCTNLIRIVQLFLKVCRFSPIW